MSKALQIPLDPSVKKLMDIPYTYSFVIKKRMQIDSLNELSKEKRPPDDIIWNGSQEDMEDWLDKVLKRKDKHSSDSLVLDISESDIEG